MNKEHQEDGRGALKRLGAEGIGALVILIVCMIWIEESVRLSKQPNMAGPCLFPFLLSLFCLLCSGLWLFNVIRSPRAASFRRPKSLTVMVFAALVGYALIVPYSGFALATFLFLATIIAVFREYAWWKVLLFSAVLSIGYYFIFQKWLFISFPRGIFD